MSTTLPPATQESRTETRRDGTVVVLFWTAVALASALPQIVVTELTGSAPWPLACGQVAALLALWAAARGSDRLRALDAPLRWLLNRRRVSALFKPLL